MKIDRIFIIFIVLIIFFKNLPPQKVSDVSRGKTVTLRRRPTTNSTTQNVENLDTVQEDNDYNTTIENSHATTIV